MKPTTNKKTEAGFDKQLPMFVLDVLRYDIENISSVLNLLNDHSGTVGWREFWPRDFSSQDILPVLEELIEGELIVPYALDSKGAELVQSPDRGAGLRNEPQKYWFLISPKGLKKWENWTDFPTTPE